MMIFDIILDSVLILLSYVVPKNKSLILFGAHLGKTFNGNPRYLIEYLQNSECKTYEYFWVTKNKNVLSKLQKIGFPVVYQYSMKGLWKIIRARYLIIDFVPKDVMPFGETTLGNFYYINTWHGSFIKKIGKLALQYGRTISWLEYFGVSKFVQTKIKVKVYDRLIHYKKFLAASDFVKEKLENCFKSDSFIISGYPRNDALFKQDRNELYEHFNIHKYKEVFLYAPTYRDYNTKSIPFTEESLDQLNNLMVEIASLMLIKVHPLDDKFESLGDKSNIKMIPDCYDDIYEAMKFSDCLITDYSGVYFDYIIKDKPVIFYQYDIIDYDKSRGIFHDIFNLLPGPFAYSFNDLLKLIKKRQEWFFNSEYQDFHNKSKNIFNYDKDGCFCKKFFDHIGINTER